MTGAPEVKHVHLYKIGGTAFCVTCRKCRDTVPVELVEKDGCWGFVFVDELCKCGSNDFLVTTRSKKERAHGR